MKRYTAEIMILLLIVMVSAVIWWASFAAKNDIGMIGFISPFILLPYVFFKITED